MATSGQIVATIAKSHVKEEKVTAPIAKSFPGQTKKKTSEAARQSIFQALPSPPPSPGDSTSSEVERKAHKVVFGIQEKDLVVFRL